MNKMIVSNLKIVLLCLSMFFLSACATTGALDERDPWEGFNRGVYSFNEVMDDLIFNPISELYNFITPDFLNKGISNFFSNLAQISVIANDILQFKFDQVVNDTTRLLINSTVGLMGIFDVASSAGLYSSEEDFGQTLAYWGIGPGPYLVVPFFGPATVRDAAGFAVDRGILSPLMYIDDDLTRAGLLSLNYVDFKADLLSTRDLIGEAAVDEYDFVKNAYFEKRASQMNDDPFEGFPEK
ncbi:MAG: VacJ family lipoprotein [Proteobacteria bacterium]|nr:VacJ family lipoprotein [Pseudomonadota bacterium]